MSNLLRVMNHQQPSHLLSLPPELLLEIVSHLSDPTIPVPFYPEPQCCQCTAFPLPNDEDLMQRFDTLRSLSQTCQTFRNLVIPQLWESLDIVKPSMYHWKDRTDEANCQAAMSRYISHVIDFVLGNEHNLVDYIRTVNMVLVTPEAETIYPKFSRFLSHLPNLSTLQILHLPKDNANDISDAFAFLPPLTNLHTLSLPRWAFPVLTVTPNIKSLFCDTGDWRWTLDHDMVDDSLAYCGLFYVLQAVKTSCPHIEQFGVSEPLFEIVSRADVNSDEEFDELSTTKAIVNVMPNLRTFPLIKVSLPVLEHTIHLAKLKHLDTVDIRLDVDLDEYVKSLVRYYHVFFDVSKPLGGQRIIRASTDPRSFEFEVTIVVDLDKPKSDYVLLSTPTARHGAVEWMLSAVR